MTMLRDAACLKILSTREALIDAQQRRQERVNDLADANNTLKDRRETEDKRLEELQAARQSKSHAAIEESAEHLGAAAEDRKRADDAREMADRKARQAKRLAGDLETRMLNTIDQVFGLGDHGQRTLDAPGDDGPDAWKKIELADLMGETFAAPFVAGGMRTVIDASKALQRRGEKMILDGENQPIAAGLVAYLARSVGEFLTRRGIKHEVPYDAWAEIPETPKAAPTEAPAEEAEETEQEQAETRERASRRGPNAAKSKRVPRGSYRPEAAALVDDPVQRAHDEGRAKPEKRSKKKKTGRKKART